MSIQTVKIIGAVCIAQLILQVVRFYEGLFWIWRIVDYACAVAFFPVELVLGGNFMYSSAFNFALSLGIDTLMWSVLIIVGLKYKAPLVEKFLKKL